MVCTEKRWIGAKTLTAWFFMRFDGFLTWEAKKMEKPTPKGRFFTQKITRSLEALHLKLTKHSPPLPLRT